jgi:hypothetical protein
LSKEKLISPSGGIARSGTFCASKDSQGCQMVYFQTKPLRFGAFWTPFEWKILTSFMTIWLTLWPFALFYGNLVYFVAV